MAARAQVGVGTTTPDAKSALDIRATDKGLLIPRLTAAQRTAIINDIGSSPTPYYGGVGFCFTVYKP